MTKALLLAAIVLSALFAFQVSQREDERVNLALLGQVPPFQFTQTNCETFESKQLEGKVWIANFFFTSCGGPCPALMANLSKLRRSEDIPADIEFVSITSDPKRDDCTKLNDYSLKLSEDLKPWHFLTGELANIINFSISGLKLGASENASLHSTKVVLIDRTGAIRGYYSGLEQEDLQRLKKDLRNLHLL